MSHDTIESFVFDGKLYVTTVFIAAYFGRSVKQIGRWKSAGLKEAPKPAGLPVKGDVFFLSHVIAWNEENIVNKNKKRNADVEEPVTEENVEQFEKTATTIHEKIKQANDLLQLRGTTVESAERIKKILDALVQALKLGEQAKELIPKKDTEKAIAEMAVMLISSYKKDIKILPKECENRKSTEISEILEKNYKANIEKFQRLAKLKDSSEKKFYDAIEAIIRLLGQGMPISEVMERLERE